MQMNVNKDPQKATQKCAWLEKKKLQEWRWCIWQVCISLTMLYNKLFLCRKIEV